METKAVEILNLIVKKDLHELTENDIVFLRARSFYLTPEQKEKYESVLNGDFALAVEEQEDNGKLKNEILYEVSLSELKDRGAVFGLKYKVGTKKSEFEKLVLKAEQENNDASLTL